MSKPMKKDIKFWLNIFTLFALVGLIVITRHQVMEAFRKLGELNAAALLLMIPLQLANYYAVARLYQDYFKAQGENLPTRTMYSIALELNFVNHVFPSGGVSGFSYLNLRLKQSGIGTAKSALAQLVRFGLTFASFIALLFVGMFILAFRRHTSPLTILIGSSLAFMTLIGVLVGGFIISDEKRIQGFVGILPKLINKVFGVFRSKRKDIIDLNKVERTMTDLHKDYVILSNNWHQLVMPFWWALVVNMTDIMTIYVVYVAFGSFINPGALILAYGVANFAGLIAVLPGGVGVYEGLMTATLSSAGVDKALALSATVVYRILNMLIFLPIGYVLYQRVLRRGPIKLGDDTHGHIIPPVME